MTFDPRIPRLVCIYVVSKTHGVNGKTVLSKPRLNTLTFALFPQKFDPRLIIMFPRSGWTCSGCTTPKLAGLPPDVASVPEPNTMGYGFDDGPNCSHNAFYDFLSSQNQKATFFYIGSNVMDWPLQAQRAIADGHEICARES